jgi:apolipoprotein N-acyltransferase
MIETSSVNTRSTTPLISKLDSNIACIIAGLAMPLCFAPFNFAWLCFFALLPLLVSCCHPSPNTRVFRGLLFGMGYFCVGSYWFAETLVTHISYSWPVAIGGHLLITGACALAPTVFCWLSGYVYNDIASHSQPGKKLLPFFWPLFLAALWVLIEDIRFQVFGGGPWMSLGLSQIDSPIRGFIPILGEVGTSGIVIGLSQLLLIILCAINQEQIKKAASFSLLIITVVFGANYLSKIEWTENTGTPLAIAMVQTAVSQHDKKDLSKQAERLAELSNLSQPYLGKAKLIIWPETVVTLNRGDIDEALSELGIKAMFARTSILVGAYESTLNNTRFNTAFTLGYEGGQKYNKRHLVPFGEYVPDYLSFLDDHVPGDQNRSLGRDTMLIANSGTLLGISICWEGSFSRDNTPLVRAGAHILVNIANEAWFAGSSLPKQNLDAMRVRALETGRSVVRVANYGPGAIIDHRGKVTTPLKPDIANSAMGYVQPRVGTTPFLILGADFILFCSFAMVLLICIILRKVGPRI